MEVQALRVGNDRVETVLNSQDLSQLTVPQEVNSLRHRTVEMMEGIQSRNRERLVKVGGSYWIYKCKRMGVSQCKV